MVSVRRKEPLEREACVGIIPKDAIRGRQVQPRNVRLPENISAHGERNGKSPHLYGRGDFPRDLVAEAASSVSTGSPNKFHVRRTSASVMPSLAASVTLPIGSV